jgi:galactokinase
MTDGSIMDDLTDLERSTIDNFRKRFDVAPEVLARAPGRVELLGNHTDYNGGLVMAAAIDRATLVAGTRCPDSDIRRVWSEAFSESFHPKQDIAPPSGSWQRYVLGSELAMQAAPIGYDALIAGDIPIGTGLSSSASLEVAFSLFINQLASVKQCDLTIDAARMKLARELQRVENEYVGVACGLLDQFAVLLGRANHALWLDCRTLEYGRVPLGDPAPAIVICDSKTSRRLADGMYNQRRAECESVVEYFRKIHGPSSAGSLRDISLADLETEWSRLDPIGRKRARHVLKENERVREGIEFLEHGHVATFGRLMSESHESSRDDFENSSPALDALIEAAEGSPGFLGGKLSGAGWAGCTVNLVRAEHAGAFKDSLIARYERRMSVRPDVHICHATDGASSRHLLLQRGSIPRA